jgi:ribosome-binding protein aMBF1 (putative translation factor)
VAKAEIEMDARKRRTLEAAGWRFGDAEDFLDLTSAERQLLDLRIKAANAVRDLRKKRGMSQKELADVLNTSQPRITKIEQAASDVSLDQIVRAYTVIGGWTDLTFAVPKSSLKRRRRAPRKKRVEVPK